MRKRRRFQLIPNWRGCLRMYSQMAFVSAGALQSAWAMLDAKQKAAIPDEWVTYITIIILVLGFIGRIVYQPKLHEGKK